MSQTLLFMHFVIMQSQSQSSILKRPTVLTTSVSINTSVAIIRLYINNTGVFWRKYYIHSILDLNFNGDRCHTLYFYHYPSKIRFCKRYGISREINFLFYLLLI